MLDDLSAGHREAVPAGVPLVELAIHDRDRVADALREHRIDAVMHFAAWLVVPDSVRDPLGYYQNNVVGSLALLGAMVDAGVQRLVFSSTCAVYGEPSTVPIVGDARASGRSTPTARRSSRSSGRWSTSSARTGCAGSRCGISTPRARIPTARSARITRPRSTSFRGRSRRPPVATRCRCSGRIIRRRTGPVCATIFTCATWRTRTCWRCGRSSAGAASGAYNAGTGQPHSVKQVIDTVSRVVGAPVQWTPAPRRPGDPAALYAASDRLQRELGLAAAIRRARTDRAARVAMAPGRIRTAIAAALRAHSRPDGSIPPAASLRGSSPHADRRRDAGDAGVRRGVGGAGVVDQADHRRRPAVAVALSQFVAIAIVVAYFFKGVGGYFSSYLMDDLGHRVVMRLRNDLFRHLLDQSAAFFSRRTTGALLSRINNDVGQVQRAVAETVGDLARETLAARRTSRRCCSITTRAWRCCA